MKGNSINLDKMENNWHVIEVPFQAPKDLIAVIEIEIDKKQKPKPR